MDIKDKKLLYFLDLNSRMKESELAEHLATSKQVINYRINRLKKEKIIKKFQTVLNLESLGITIYASVYFKLLEASRTKEEEIISFLLKSNDVGYVAKLGGRFDLSIVLVAKNLRELEEKLNEIVGKYPNELREFVVSLRTFGLKFHKKYLFNGKYEESKKILTKEREIVKIDELDKKILKLLAEDSKIQIIALSEKLKIPFSTARSRIKALENKGVIAGYSLLFDLAKIGMVNYKLFIKTRDKSEKFYKKLLSFAKSHPNIIWFFKTLGDHDYELRIEVENQEKYQEVIKEIRSEFSSFIEELEMIIVFNELKEDYSIVLENS